MDKYRILEKIDNTNVIRETRAHIVVKPSVEFIVERYVNNYIFFGFWIMHSRHKSMESAKRMIEQETEKHVVTKVHKVTYA